MKPVSKTIILSILMMALASCTNFMAKPTETPTPTATSSPTSTPTITPTRKPTQTPTIPGLKMPTGKPVSSWEGFPIMPNAIAGEGDSSGYAFTIIASSDEVQNFYKNQMPTIGWDLMASGQGTTGALLLMFTKGSELVSLSIIPQPDGVMYVLLVK